jgi:hypothetical protein
VFVQLIPVATVPRDPSGMVLNIILFLPLGVLLPFLVRGSVSCGTATMNARTPRARAEPDPSRAM